MSEKADAMTADDTHPAEPGIGLALLTVLVMLLVTGILAAIIYLLMVAISPIEQRTPKSRAPDAATVEQKAPAAPAPGARAAPQAPAAPAPAPAK